MSVNGSFKIRTGDRLPVLTVTATAKNLIVAVTNPTGLVDFTGWTLTFRMVGPVTITGSATGSAAGVLEYAWAAGNTATPGVYLGVFEGTDPDDKIQTFPTEGEIEIEILEDI